MLNVREKSKVSQTASYTCFCRACADAERDERFRGPDSVAKVFVPFLPTVLFLKCRLLRELVMKRISPRGIYEYVTARTRLFDEEFRNAMEESIPQIVIFGAGFDTRAWRIRHPDHGTRVFELDTPVTQQMKIRLLEKKGIGFPEEVTFVPINFEKKDITGALGKAGYCGNLKSLFMLEGITMYLSGEAVDGTLEFIRQNTLPGSRVIFDYIRAPVLRRENKYYGEAAIHKTIFNTGEVWRFGIEDREIATFLHERGLKLIAHYMPGALQDRFLTADDGTVYGRINETHCIAIAAVNNDTK